MRGAIYPALPPLRRNYTPAPPAVPLHTAVPRARDTDAMAAEAELDPDDLIALDLDAATQRQAAQVEAFTAGRLRPPAGDPLPAAPSQGADPPGRGHHITPGTGLALGANAPAVVQAARARGAQRGLASRTVSADLARWRPGATQEANLARGRRPKPNSPGLVAVNYLRQTRLALTTAEIIAHCDMTITRRGLSAWLAAAAYRGRISRTVGADRQIRYHLPDVDPTAGGAPSPLFSVTPTEDRP